MPFFQVLLLLTLLAYLLLIALENPGFVRLPLPFGQGDAALPVGLTVVGAALLGGAYVLLLLAPALMRSFLDQRQERRKRQATERHLAETLAARLAAAPAVHSPASPSSGSEEA